MADSSSILPPGAPGVRRTEDIALDLMRFIALTTGYGKAQSGPGFSSKPGSSGSEAYADTLLQLYQRCLEVVGNKPGRD